MQLESLANELLLDMFEYLKAVHLLRAFHGLNSRFNTLLYGYSGLYHLDFRSVSKRDFDIVCTQHLSSIIDRVVAVCLSDDDETSNQCNHFLSYGFTLDQFIHLQSLVLDDLRSPKTVLNIIFNCRQLSSLSYLKITGCRFRETNAFIGLIDNVWRFSKLIHCILDDALESSFSFIAPPVISASIEYLSIKNVPCHFDELARLFEHTPRLRHLCATVVPIHDDEQLLTVAPSINTLNISFKGHSTLAMVRLLQNTPNLSHLIFDTENIYLDGHQWKTIIIDHLPMIKVFRLKMSFTLPQIGNTEEQVDEYLDTFRTAFWIDEHHWFVRCDWSTQPTPHICLYTLPYTFAEFSTKHHTQSKSTCPNDGDYWSYNRVHHLCYQNYLFEDMKLCPIRFLNIHHLRIRFPADDNFWFVISTFDRLTSLEVSLRTNGTRNLRRLFLNRIPRLYHLFIDKTSFLRLATLRIRIPSIRRLDLLQFDLSYFNSAHCSILASSPFGLQCEVLTIGVDDRRHVLHLINKMSNLRALIFRCQGDKWNRNGSSSVRTTDDLVEWLRDRLPSNYSINRDTRQCDRVRIWIG